MSNTINYKLLILLVLLNYGILNHSRVQAASDQPTYKIEAIAFKSLIGRETRENWPSWADKSAKQSTDAASEQPLPVRLQQQPASNSNMTSLMDKMMKSGDYIVLDHRAWFQYADARSSSPASYYDARYENIGYLKGHIQFYMSRFLHININLDLVPVHFDEERVIRTESGNSESGEIPRPVYSITQSKRVASEEYYYFDHPEFGVIVYIRPIKK